jgi:F1F0 ATPase subunit 2
MDAQAMTGVDLAAHDMLRLILNASPWLAIGALMGAFHFLILQWSVQMLATGSPVLLALASQLIRFAVMAATLGVIARHYGAGALLAATLGVLASGSAAVRVGARL